MKPILEIRSLNVAYGAARALWNVSLNIQAGESVAILGTNGAGKSTLLKSIMGLIKPLSGEILLNGSKISGNPAQEIVKKGIAMVPEGRRIFPSLTVEENLKIAERSQLNVRKLWSLPEVYDLFPVLKECRHRPGTHLSGGQQQMLAIGRALMANPDIILFDELSLGLAPIIIKDIYSRLQQIKQEGMTILLVEQNVKQSLEFTDKVYCMLQGRINLSGKVRDLSYDHIQHAYFGN